MGNTTSTPTAQQSVPDPVTTDEQLLKNTFGIIDQIKSLDSINSFIAFNKYKNTPIDFLILCNAFFQNCVPIKSIISMPKNLTVNNFIIFFDTILNPKLYTDAGLSRITFIREKLRVTKKYNIVENEAKEFLTRILFFDEMITFTPENKNLVLLIITKTVDPTFFGKCKNIIEKIIENNEKKSKLDLDQLVVDEASEARKMVEPDTEEAGAKLATSLVERLKALDERRINANQTSSVLVTPTAVVTPAPVTNVSSIIKKQPMSQELFDYPPLFTKYNKLSWLHSSLELLYTARSALNFNSELGKLVKPIIDDMVLQSTKSSLTPNIIEKNSNVDRLNEYVVNKFNKEIDLSGLGELVETTRLTVNSGGAPNHLFDLLTREGVIQKNDSFLILDYLKTKFEDLDSNYELVGLVSGKDTGDTHYEYVIFLKINKEWYKYDDNQTSLVRITGIDTLKLNKEIFKCSTDNKKYVSLNGYKCQYMLYQHRVNIYSSSVPVLVPIEATVSNTLPPSVVSSLPPTPVPVPVEATVSNTLPPSVVSSLPSTPVPVPVQNTVVPSILRSKEPVLSELQFPPIVEPRPKIPNNIPPVTKPLMKQQSIYTDQNRFMGCKKLCVDSVITSYCTETEFYNFAKKTLEQIIDEESLKINLWNAYYALGSSYDKDAPNGSKIRNLKRSQWSELTALKCDKFLSVSFDKESTLETFLNDIFGDEKKGYRIYKCNFLMKDAPFLINFLVESKTKDVKYREILKKYAEKNKIVLKCDIEVLAPTKQKVKILDTIIPPLVPQKNDNTIPSGTNVFPSTIQNGNTIPNSLSSGTNVFPSTIQNGNTISNSLSSGTNVFPSTIQNGNTIPNSLSSTDDIFPSSVPSIAQPYKNIFPTDEDDTPQLGLPIIPVSTKLDPYTLIVKSSRNNKSLKGVLRYEIINYSEFLKNTNCNYFKKYEILRIDLDSDDSDYKKTKEAALKIEKECRSSALEVHITYTHNKVTNLFNYVKAKVKSNKGNTVRSEPLNDLKSFFNNVLNEDIKLTEPIEPTKIITAVEQQMFEEEKTELIDEIEADKTELEEKMIQQQDLEEKLITEKQSLIREQTVNRVIPDASNTGIYYDKNGTTLCLTSACPLPDTVSRSLITVDEEELKELDQEIKTLREDVTVLETELRKLSEDEEYFEMNKVKIYQTYIDLQNSVCEKYLKRKKYINDLNNLIALKKRYNLKNPRNEIVLMLTKRTDVTMPADITLEQIEKERRNI